MEIKERHIDAFNELRSQHRRTFTGAARARLMALATKAGSRMSVRLLAYGIPAVGQLVAAAEIALSCSTAHAAEPYRVYPSDLGVAECLQKRQQLIAVSDEITERFGTTETACTEDARVELGRLLEERSRLETYTRACYDNFVILNPATMPQSDGEDPDSQLWECPAEPSAPSNEESPSGEPSGDSDPPIDDEA